MKKPSARVMRGLRWVLMTANADFEIVADEKDTGHFSGTSTNEVSEALEWLRLMINASTRNADK